MELFWIDKKKRRKSQIVKDFGAVKEKLSELYSGGITKAKLKTDASTSYVFIHFRGRWVQDKSLK